MNKIVRVFISNDQNTHPAILLARTKALLLFASECLTIKMNHQIKLLINSGLFVSNDPEIILLKHKRNFFLFLVDHSIDFKEGNVNF